MRQRYTPCRRLPLPVMHACVIARARAVTLGAPHLVFLSRRSARPYQELDNLRQLLVHGPLEGRPPFAAADSPSITTPLGALHAGAGGLGGAGGWMRRGVPVDGVDDGLALHEHVRAAVTKCERCTEGARLNDATM